MVMLERLRGYSFPKVDDELTGAQRTEEMVAARLRKSGYPDLANIRFDFHEGVLVLRGRLPTYYLKQ
ncbi:MAG TPA: BON domain-containing protein, partial [Planctomycetaceae bacterium]|nr:BON domain-containing protein [Planctomycetaceae bacterium]